jgi:hypothetical protein
MLRGVSFGSTRKGTLMRGGIQKKGNRRYAVVYDGIDPGTGKKRRRWVPAGTRRSDAERVLSDVIRRKYDGEPAPTEKLTVGQYLTQRWLPIQKSKVRAASCTVTRLLRIGHCWLLS